MRHTLLGLIASSVLLVSALSPSASADDELEQGKTYVVLTLDGAVSTVLLIKQAGVSIVLKAAGGKELTIRRSDIEAIQEVDDRAARWSA